MVLVRSGRRGFFLTWANLQARAPLSKEGCLGLMRDEDRVFVVFVDGPIIRAYFVSYCAHMHSANSSPVSLTNGDLSVVLESISGWENGEHRATQVGLLAFQSTHTALKF